jgi:Icc-related predicted phosphoesterase
MPQMENPANLRRQYGDIELIISCGDLPSVYLEFMTSVLNVPLFYVRGNHDEQYEEHPPGGNDLHQRLLEFNGLTFFGLEGSIRYNRSPIQYSDQQMNQMVLTAFPILQFNNFRRGRLDVLVTHSPARGIHDADDIPHQGFGSLLRFMEWYKPRYMLHGHVHTWDRRKQTRSTFHETEIININPVSVLEIDTD